jgi:ubiquinone/menaquinone biosynthesis C-methylase UbiE
MQSPLRYRKDIPFFYDKSEKEFRADNYEHFDEMVTRQTALHLADQLWKAYPLQPVLDLITKRLQIPKKAKVVELGCSVGRIIGDLAKANPTATFWGIDYSYQMLKRAKEFWIDGKTIHLDFSFKGMKPVLLPGKQLTNLNFGLAKGEDLPFSDNSQDAVISSFLLDRLTDPIQGLKEMHRVLKKGGQMVLVSPLNFTKVEDWEALYPPQKISQHLDYIGFGVEYFDENLMIIEPMDVHGNVVLWKCMAVVATKNA